MTFYRRINIAVLAFGALLAAPGVLSCAANSAPARHGMPIEPAPTCDRDNFRLLLDVGHTPDAPGARSARGVDEYQFNLVLTRDLADVLRGRGFDKTMVMITQGPTRPGLVSRVAQINRLAPDLLLSIHHDSVPTALLEQFEYDDKLHDFSDRFSGHSIFVSANNLHYAASVVFARTMGTEMEARGLHYTPHYTDRIMGERRRILIDDKAGVYRYDQLLVLKNTRVPSVLLEAGMIINREEEWQLHLPQYRARITGAIADAVDLYCRLKPPAPVNASKPSPQLVVNAAPPVRVAARKSAAGKMAAHAGRKSARHAAIRLPHAARK